MRKSDFSFDLPKELIAQAPAEPRDAAQLMCLGRTSGQIEHRRFSELPTLLRAGDVLVVNNSRVMPARLIGQRRGGTGACELLLLRQDANGVWECLAKPGKRLRPGSVVDFGDGSLSAELLKTLENGGKLVRFTYDTPTLYEKLEQFGQMPLPPYIRAQLASNDDYQTVYAKETGSAAAPTAGLHFTPRLMQQLKNAGVFIAELTLHVGLGTFRPVQAEEVENHHMHSEWYALDEAASQVINNAKAAGGRVIAVGTTSCRTLESVVRQHGGIRPASGETDIFLYPGSRFLATDGLITNFHLPESTLIMLVAAFCGLENTLAAYEEAIRQQYRFFSFGDAMFII